MKNGTRLFIVEDEDVLAEIYTERFKQAGFDVTRFSNGLDFISALADKTPDVVLLDINMPEMNGFEAIKTINENFQSADKKNVKIIVWSNSSNDAEMENARKLGVKLFLKKVEYSGNDLVEKVKKFLSENN